MYEPMPIELQPNELKEELIKLKKNHSMQINELRDEISKLKEADKRQNMKNDSISKKYDSLYQRHLKLIQQLNVAFRNINTKQSRVENFYTQLNRANETSRQNRTNSKKRN
jgi:hypothetical protein